MRVAFIAAAILVVAFGVNRATRPQAPEIVRASAGAAPSADTPISRGRVVYGRYGCSTCHGVDGKGGFSNPNAETEGKVPPVNYVAEGFTKAELKKKVLDGFAPVGRKDPNGARPPFRMPGWAGQMSDREVSDLVEFLWSLYPKSESEKWR